ncbi:TatD family hydrolase [Mycobacterium timonense]|uniref:Hydrolase TatD n=1 Tax=Mycobacterium bouchedurhonense TaxID=701041 RepID=A0AAW5S042_MYCBC|nr:MULTISPECIES: TatD family hydrolase [Mycobacterium avium complex (MAC)]KDO92260.1 TatD family hydrolase [Mycobacterium avium subsp. hominissuis 3388]MBZ4613751.1 TatD family deoxyribonuclease [Mycobacterium avium subsp. hominissuis]MCV6988721.1 TatD family hydrolase [Mycobacterium bouchedurhonense]MCV6996028.1 TatD family hydrolase [Mycobacterium timonense]ORA41903.1 hydrolase TatD [Mycobacterium bouchedurhonense]
MSAERLLDTHCHVSAYADPVATLRDADQAGVAVVAVTEDPDEYRRLRTRLGRREHVEVALGLHPLRAASFGPNDLARFFRLVPQTNWIGEVGLDYSRAGAATAKAQQRVFDVVLTEAQPGRHPLTVHSRGAEEDVVERLAAAGLPAVLHWYSGPLNLIGEALQAGLYFSINVAMTRSRKFPSLMREIPQDRILLETDGPYAKDRGRPARPNGLEDVATALGYFWGTDLAATTKIVRANQKRFLNRS